MTQLKNAKFFTFNKPDKNYVDKIILVLLGKLLNERFDEFIIVSNDKIFKNLDFVEEIFGKKVTFLNSMDKNKITSTAQDVTDKKVNFEKIENMFYKNITKINSLINKSTNLTDFKQRLNAGFRNSDKKIFTYMIENHKYLLDKLSK